MRVKVKRRLVHIHTHTPRLHYPCVFTLQVKHTHTRNSEILGHHYLQTRTLKHPQNNNQIVQGNVNTHGKLLSLSHSISLSTLEIQLWTHGQLINSEWERTIWTNGLQRKKRRCNLMRDSRTGDRSRAKAKTGCSNQGERATDTPTQTRRKYSPVCTLLQRKEQDYLCNYFLYFLFIIEVGSHLSNMTYSRTSHETKRSTQLQHMPDYSLQTDAVSMATST